MKRSFVIVISAIISIFTTQFSIAGEHQEDSDSDRQFRNRPSPEVMFGRMDNNSDGKISREEFGKTPGFLFKRMDLDEDGTITLSEMKSAAKKHHEDRQKKMNEHFNARFEKIDERFAEMDSDGNGKVTRDEARRSMFDKMDSDGDGFLTQKEMKPPRGEKPRRDQIP